MRRAWSNLHTQKDKGSSSLYNLDCDGEYHLIPRCAKTRNIDSLFIPSNIVLVHQHENAQGEPLVNGGVWADTDNSSCSPVKLESKIDIDSLLSSLEDRAITNDLTKPSTPRIAAEALHQLQAHDCPGLKR